MAERRCAVGHETRGRLTDLFLSMYSDPGAPDVVPGEEARSRFYEAYKRQANRFDKELKEYNKELNITLLFVRPVTITVPNKGYIK